MLRLKPACKFILLILTIISITILSGCATRHPKTTPNPSKKMQYTPPPENKKYADNSELAKKVRSSLSADKEIKDLPITVLTSNNVVELSGFVADEKQKQKAVAITQQVKGVRAVLDALLVNKEEAPMVVNNT